MERLALQKISTFVRSPPVFSSSDKVSALIGELRRLGAYEALVESGSKPKLITLLDLLKASDPERTSIGKIARAAVPISFEAPILEAADLMAMNEAWSLIVKRGDEVLGVISQLDLVSALSRHHLLQDVSCGEIMRSDPPRVSAEDKLSKARSIMRKMDLPYLPVVRDESLVGGLSIEDLVFNMLQPRESATRGDRGGGDSRIWSIPVKSVMDRSPIRVGRDHPASEALERMLSMKKNACMVEEASRLLGVITPRELISTLLRFKPEEEPRIYVLGLPEAGDFLELKTAEDKLARTFDRVFKRHKPIVEVVIDIKRKKIRGERALYRVSARIYFPGRILNVSAQGWYLSRVLDDLCRKLSRMRSRERRRPPRGAGLR